MVGGDKREAHLHIHNSARAQAKTAKKQKHLDVFVFDRQRRVFRDRSVQGEPFFEPQLHHCSLYTDTLPNHHPPQPKPPKT